MSPGDETGGAPRRTHLANERTRPAGWRTGCTTVAALTAVLVVVDA